jgi:RNAse (barnase) inhibitor barstar
MDSEIIDVDLRGAAKREDLQEQLALALGFPVYNGRNWDAFWDCLTTLETMPRQIRIKGIKAMSESFPLEAALLRKHLDDFKASPRGAGVEVSFE